jgi:3',5'-cyclic AMP phosphodiesterase CpdA
MRTIIQVSDLHFGAILPTTLEPLLAFMHAAKPDLVIISGDLSQRASAAQCREAAAYLARMPMPRLVIPGNHDVPLYNLFRRFLSPLDEYERYISTDHAPSFIDGEIAVVGLNSARSVTIKGGSLRAEQVSVAVDQLGHATAGQVRIVVTHHPFDIPVALSGVEVVDRAREAVQSFQQRDVDLFLTGHLHQIHRAKASEYAPGYHATLLGAGTATSNRARGEPNSFFLFRIDHLRNDDQCIVAETHAWHAEHNQFELVDTRSLPRVSISPVTAVGRADQGQGSGITA